MRHWIFCCAVFFVLSAAQPLFAQSNVAFAPEVYQARRDKLVMEIRDAVAIVPSRYLIRRLSWGQVKMDPDFWYLTGLETVYAVLIVTPERTAIFLPEEHQFLGGQYPMADFEDFRLARWNRPANLRKCRTQQQPVVHRASAYL